MIKYINIIFLSLFLYNININAQSCNLEIEYDSNGPVLNFDCNYDEAELRFIINITSITGGSGVYAIETFGEGILSNTLATSNNGFFYSFTENDKDNGDIGFVVYDGLNDTCYMNVDIQSGLYFLEFIWCNDDFPSCDEAITIDFESGQHLDLFNCTNDSSLNLTVNDVFGGDGDYLISSLGAGTIDMINEEDSVSFTYQFDQDDINAHTSEIGFFIEDESGCTKRVDFSGMMAYTEITDYCLVIDIEEHEFRNEILIYPTIVHNELNLVSKSGSPFSSIGIFNNSGQQIWYIDHVNESKTHIDLSKFPSGVYIVKSLLENDLLYSNKFIIH